MKRLIVVVSAISLVAFGWASVTGAAVPTMRSHEGPEMMARGDFSRHSVDVFFTKKASLNRNCSGTMRFDRRTTGPDVLQDAISLLMRGPRAGETKKGAVSAFSHRTAGMLNSVSVSGGVASIDFDDLRRVIPEASASCGATSLLSQLKRTAKQFPTVDRVLFSLEGNRRAFYNWLQMETPQL